MKNTRRYRYVIFAFLSLLIFAFAFNEANSQVSRSYVYKSVRADISIEEDASILVDETLTYSFQGIYHQGFRKIPLKGIGDITGVIVYDGETNVPYIESKRALDKNLLSSWGKFFRRRISGNEEIEWYYNAENEVRSWVIHYRAHGAVTFLTDKDELYWNVFSGFDVPVEQAEAVVTVPVQYSESQMSARVYVLEPVTAGWRITPPDGAYFYGRDFGAFQPFTIAFGWPKGYAQKSEYYKDLIFTNLGIILSVAIIIGFIAAGFFYWYFTERYKKGRGTVVPQYEPPQNLRPAVAEVLIREMVTPKTWSATLIDLAVRGFVKVEEDRNLTRRYVIIGISIAVVFFGSIVTLFTLDRKGLLGLFMFLMLFSIIVAVRIFRNIPMSRDYIVRKTREFEDDVSLYKYEKDFLSALFKNHSVFSTAEMRRAPESAKRDMYHRIKDIKEEIYLQADLRPNMFEKKISSEKIRVVWIASISVAVWIIIFAFMPARFFSDNEIFLPFIILVLGSLFFWFFIKYEARLSAEGQVLREEWLGFKLYLETAEKYRMQNLTPEIFEKYLPYAVIFKVEKKWGKAFDSLNLAPPSWYSGTYAGGIHSHGISAAGFSASAFSSSFSSSISSALSSAGAGGGASGGGGGAGGGGGGGGGGAG